MKQDHSFSKLGDRVAEEAKELQDAISEGHAGKIAEEAADVILEVCNLFIYAGIENVEAILAAKIKKNEQRFPASQFQRGDFKVIYESRKRELGER